MDSYPIVTGILMKEGNVEAGTYIGRVPRKNKGRDWSDTSTGSV